MCEENIYNNNRLEISKLVDEQIKSDGKNVELKKLELSILTCNLCDSSLISLNLHKDVEGKKEYYYIFVECETCKLKNGFKVEKDSLNEN